MRTLKLLFLAMLMAVGAWAQRAPHLDPETDVKIGFQKGAVVVSVPEGAHLKKSFMEVTLKSKPGSLRVGPLPKTTGVDELGDPVWHGTVRIPVLGEGLAGTAELDVQYQPCTEGEGGVCFPPTTRTLKVKASDIPAAKAPEISEVNVEEKAEGAALKVGTPGAEVQPQKAAATVVPPERRGLFWAFILVFLAGLGASLTPCVFPMIPITMPSSGRRTSARPRASRCP